MDPWAEFLRRILLSASLAGVGGIAAAKGPGPATEIADAEPRPEPPPEPPRR